MRKVKVFCFLLIAIFFLSLKIYSQEVEFTSHTIVGGEGAVNNAYSVYVADVDGDGDMDVLSASRWDDKIAWYENDGDENFNAHTITTSADGAKSVYAVDVDGDGDMDVLSASWDDNKIAWYENDGDENFNAQTITTSADGAKSVYAVDVDGDGDMDVLSASSLDSKIAWYENLQITGINEDNNLILIFNDLRNFPNPFNPTTTISFSIPKESNVDLSIYNIKGQKIKKLEIRNLKLGINEVVWDGTDNDNKPVSSGIYFYQLKAGEFEEIKKMILLK